MGMTAEEAARELLETGTFDKSNFDKHNMMVMGNKFLRGLHPNISRKLMASQPLTPQENVQFQNHVVDHIGALAQLGTGGAGGYSGGGYGGGGRSWDKEAAGGVATVGEINRLMIESKGDQNIRIVRKTANIAQTLPVPVFYPNGIESNFKSLVNRYFPAGVSITTTAYDATTGNLNVTYKDGAGNVDIITISLAGLNNTYADLQNALKNSQMFKTKLVQMPIVDSSVTDISQSLLWKQAIYFGDVTSLGSTSANQLIPDSRRNEYIQLKDRVSLIMPKEQKIDANYAWISELIAVANCEVDLNFFMSEALEPATK